MKKTYKAITFLMVLALLATALTGCTTYDNFVNTFFTEDEAPEDTVRFGVYEPLTGPDAEQGKLEKIGIELAHELYPTALAKPIELVYADHKSDIYVAEAAINELISKRPAIVLGSYGSVYSLIAVDPLEKAKIPAIAITNTNPLVTSNNPFYFRVCFVDSYQGVAVAKYAVEVLNVSTAAVLKPKQDDQATAFSQTFSDKMRQLTQDPNAIVTIQEYTSGNKDFEKQLTKIQESGVKVVFMPAGVSDAAKILKQAHEMKLDLIFLGTQEWESPELIEKAGAEAVENVAFSSVFDPESGITAMTDVFLQAYKAKYGEDAVPEPAVALGFDAYIIAVNSINRIGTALNGDLLCQSLALERDFSGASGSISFDENGDPIKSVVIKKIHNGEFVNAHTIVPAWVVQGQ